MCVCVFASVHRYRYQNCYHATHCDVGVSAFQDISTVACSTVMGLLCIPLSELVSFAFSTIPIIYYVPFEFFHLLVAIGLVDEFIYNITRH